MTDKEFRKLKRHELVEIIYQLQLNIEELEKENADMKLAIEELRKTPAYVSAPVTDINIKEETPTEAYTEVEPQTETIEEFEVEPIDIEGFEIEDIVEDEEEASDAAQAMPYYSSSTADIVAKLMAKRSKE